MLVAAGQLGQSEARNDDPPSRWRVLTTDVDGDRYVATRDFSEVQFHAAHEKLKSQGDIKRREVSWTQEEASPEEIKSREVELG